MGQDNDDRQRLGDFRFGRDREEAERRRQPARPSPPGRRGSPPGRAAPAARRAAPRRARPEPTGRRSGRGFVVGLAAVSLVIAGAGLFGLSRLLAPPPAATTQTADPTAAPAGARAEPTAAAPLNWVVTFEYHFPLGYWTPGQHAYTLESYCPGLAGASGAWRSTVNVSENAPIRPQRVFLRATGVLDEVIGGLVVGAIHPSQASGAAFSLVYPTREEVERGVQDCVVTVSVDGRTPVPLEPRIPYQR